MNINLTNSKVFSIFVLLLVISSCKDDEKANLPSLTLKTGGIYTNDSAYLALNDSIIIGIIGKGDGINITNLKITSRNDSNQIITLVDDGLNAESINIDKILYKGISTKEVLTISIMDRDRNSISKQITVFKDSTSGFSNIYHHTSIFLGYPSNASYGHYLDPFNGIVYSDSEVAGNEANIHIMSYYYLSSGNPSPTFICPGQDDAASQYPLISGWNVLNTTQYDYHSTDYNLISDEEFDACDNDSILIVSFDPQYTNPKCKFATSGKIVPFQTANGKYGLIKVVHADHAADGYMELEIKVQK